MTEHDNAVNVLIDAIVAKAKVIHDDPKAELYIRKKIAIIYHVGKELGQQALADEIMEGSH